MADIESPCVNICRMDEDGAVCVGCFRSLEEIAAWGDASAARKIEILVASERRRKELDPWGDGLRGECER